MTNVLALTPMRAISVIWSAEAGLTESPRPRECGFEAFSVFTGNMDLF